MNIYLLATLIIFIVLTIYFRKTDKREGFSPYVGERCYAGVSNRKLNGDKAFYTNYMNLDYFNRKKAILSQYDKDKKTIKDLLDYKDILYKSQDKYTDLDNVYTSLNTNIDTIFTKLDNKLANEVDEASENKKEGIKRFNNIKENIGDLSGKTSSNLDNKVKPFITNAIEGELKNISDESVSSIKYKDIINNRIAPKQSKAYTWQFVGNYGAPMRINPVQGEPECLSYDGKNCEWNFHSQNGGNLNKINVNRVKPLTCGTDHNKIYGSDGYQNGHWCKNTYNALAVKHQDQVDYTNCPDGWRLLDKDRKICIAPENYNKKCKTNRNVLNSYPECKNTVCADFSGYNDRSKQDWSYSCDARYPFKVNISAIAEDQYDVEKMAKNEVNNRLGSSSGLGNLRYPKYKNGIFVNVYTLGNGFNKGNLVAGNIIVSNINYRNGSPMSFVKNATGDLGRFYLEIFGFIKVPNDVTSIQFKIGSDDGFTMKIATSGKTSDMRQIAEYWNGRPLGWTTANSVSVKAGTLMPFKIDYFNGMGWYDLILQWSLNGKGFEVVPREYFYIDNKPC